MKLCLTSARREKRDRTYPRRCVNSQQTLRLIKCQETRFTDFVLMEDLRIRSGAYSVIDVTEAVKKYHDVSLRINEGQENSIVFEEMRVSNGKGKVCYSAYTQINR